jgi:hypothetical protein
MTKTTTTVLCLLGLFAGQSAFARQGAKGLYVAREQRPEALGARNNILLRGRDGKPTVVSDTSVFHTGESIWLQLEVRRRSFVYVVNATHTSEGRTEAHLVFHETVNAGVSRRVPSGEPMTFDNVTGVEELVVVLSDQRLTGLENLFDSNGRLRLDPNKRYPEELDGLLAQYRQNTDVEAPSDGSKGLSVEPNRYAMARTDGKPIVVSVALRHV